MPIFHPQPDENGKPVMLKNPSKSTPLSSWTEPNVVATVTPNGNVPADLNGISMQDWIEIPSGPEAWNAVGGQLNFKEPQFKLPAGKVAAAGVVIMESDDRIWLVSPSNGYAGYTATFPKGRVEKGVTMQANAIREAYEESGLKVEITGFLADSSRTLTYTRYYLAKRVGGNPARMGWETQSVHLVPRSVLVSFVTHINDLPLLKVLLPIKPAANVKA